MGLYLCIFDEAGDDIFVRNLYEIRRMMYTLYNAMGEDDWIMQDGKPRLRGDGTPWIHIHYGMPEGRSIPGFWPWREAQVTESLHSSPGGEYYLDVVQGVCPFLQNYEEEPYETTANRVASDAGDSAGHVPSHRPGRFQRG